MNIENQKININEYSIMKGYNFENDKIYIDKYINEDIYNFTKIENIRVTSINTFDFLNKITDINNYTTEQIYDNLKNCLYNKEANIYSCGDSFNDFGKKMPVNKATIKICIKSSFNIINDCDIIIYDNRMNGRITKKWDLSNIFKIYMGDYFFNDFKNHICSLGPEYGFPKDDIQFLNPNLCFTCKSNSTLIDKNIISINDYYKNNIIYGNYNIFIPLIYRLLLIFDYMGIKKFNITGVDGISSNFTQSHFFDKLQKNFLNKPQIGFDSLMSFYYDSILNYNIFNIILYSNNSNANFNIPRYDNINMDYHLINKINNIQLSPELIILKNDEQFFCKFVKLLYQNKVRVLLITNYNNLDDVIINLKNNNIIINFNNIYKYLFGPEVNSYFKNINDILSKLPNDFDWKIYVQLNSNLSNLTEIEAKNHYLQFGLKEKRNYKKLPN